MRLFGYYAWHTFVNQLRKLFKTWVLIFLVACMLIGILVGLGVGALEDASVEEEPATAETEIAEEASPSLQEELGLSPGELTELLAGSIILVILVFCALGADKSGSQIFLPADVPLLFSSPLKPQSVLLFRLMTQLGASILACAYLLFQLPNLVINLGMPVWGAVGILVGFCLTIAASKLLQILLYTVFSTRPALKRHLRTGIYCVLGALLTAFLVYWKSGSSDALTAANGFFNSPISRLIPLWGWLKGFFRYAMEGNLLLCLVCLVATLAGGGALTWVIWHVRADFYEDAMAKSEETAQRLAQAQAEKGGAATGVKRKKDRPDRLQRDGMRFGSGANVFFFKSMYNRFRFARLRVFTKTSITYLVTAVAVAAVCRFGFQTDSLLPMVLTLAGLSFYRALGNPLEEDTGMDHFLLIPESTWHKLFWSLLGGTANCLLDLLPAIIVGAVMLGANPLVAFAWLPLIVSVDFFSTTVGAFINLSVPVSAGTMVKQIVQIMFIYFGLLPDIAIIAVGFVFGHPILASVGCTLLNLLMGLAFFALTPLFLEPKEGKSGVPEPPSHVDLSIAKRHFSRMGLSIFVILAVGSAAQVLAGVLTTLFCPKLLVHPWGMWILTFAPLYLIAVPAGLLLLRKVPATAPARQSVRPGQAAVTLIISIFMMYAGNLVGTLLTSALQALAPVSAENPIADLSMGTAVLPRALVMVVLAPIIEEYIFRKQLIDRMHVYGQKTAVILSAAIFGLFHGNLSQLFYAFTLGLVFGYVYLKTGKLRYSVALHMFINFLGGVLAPMLLEKIALVDTSSPAALEAATPWLLGFMGYALALLGLSIAGLVLLCVNSRKIRFEAASLQLPRGSRMRTTLCNAGMLLLLAGCLGMISMSLL